MQVLWWLVPPIVATALAMVWVAAAGRTRDDVRRDDSDEALAAMQKALARPAPRKRATSPVTSRREHSHGVAIRRAPVGMSPAPGTDAGPGVTR
jgi:hypothetical protein